MAPKANTWAPGLLGNDEPSAGSSTARSRPRWQALHDYVSAESARVYDGPMLIDWDERYVTAIQHAIEGNNYAPLVKLFHAGYPLHPALGWGVAKAFILALKPDRRKKSRTLTHSDDAHIRRMYDSMQHDEILRKRQATAADKRYTKRTEAEIYEDLSDWFSEFRVQVTRADGTKRDSMRRYGNQAEADKAAAKLKAQNIDACVRVVRHVTVPTIRRSLAATKPQSAQSPPTAKSKKASR